jgi:shikimate kinase
MGKHITLIGMLGVGKSSVAPLVAKQLNRRVIEVDQLIERQEGMPIGEIFMAKGEAYFRRTECALIAELIKEPPAVLSLGGGAFMWEATRELLLAQAVVFYLSASMEVLCVRLEGGVATRPLLNVPGASVQDTLREILVRRSQYYELAHYRVETDIHSPEDVAKAIVMMREAYE